MPPEQDPIESPENPEGPAPNQGEQIPEWGRLLGESVRSLTEATTSLLSRASAPPPVDPPEEPDPPTAAELEAMDRETYTRFVVQEVVKSVHKEVVAPLNEKIGQITAKTEEVQIVGAVKEMEARHKDFWDWKDEMLAIGRTHPGLTPQYLYQLAKVNNPAKAEKLAAKYAPPKPTTAPRFSFGGLPPGGAQGSGAKVKVMSPDEAARAAWAATEKALGGAPPNDDDS